jgi:SAM-dependent methyltransferase
MKHADHVNLIRNGIPPAKADSPSQTWADLGSGQGAFTLALAELLPPGGVIYSVDRDSAALREQESAFGVQFPRTKVHFLVADFTHPLNLPPLDGVIMANSLHFQRNHEQIIRTVKSYLKPSGRLILVEYDADRGNFWVPHPLSFPTWKKSATRCGFSHTQLLATYPSRFLGQIYAAVSW